jgi:hypothetical protein
LSRCTVSNNTAHDGGGIITGGNFQSCHVYLDLINSTVSGNQATAWGGGIQAWTWDCKDITVNLSHSTVTANAANDGGGLHRWGDVTFILQNSIVAGNTDNHTTPSWRDCSGGIRQSQGYNLISAAYGCPNNGTTDITPRTPLTDDLDLVLADNGGFAPTHALPAGSQAIDAIPAGVNGCGTTYTVDQRGEPRPQNGRCDIGAYETAGAVLDIHVYLPLVMRAFAAPPDGR